MRRLAAGLLWIATGVVVGLLTVLVHGQWWGLALGLATTLAVTRALRRGWPRGLFALGWVALVGAVLPTRPEGDFLIAANPQGVVLLGAGFALIVAVLVTVGTPRAAARGGNGTRPGRD
jgi:hypothetical protein